MSSPLEQAPLRYEFERLPGRGHPIPPEQWAAFLDELRHGERCRGNKVLAARAAGISYMSVARRCKADPEFAEEVEVALQEAGHVLLAAAWDRAIDKSDPLMLRLLEAFLPGHFSRDRRVDVQVTHRAPIVLTPEERAAIEPIGRRLLLQGAPGFVDDAEWYATETPAVGTTPTTDEDAP